MKKCLSGILLGALVFCCGAAENYKSVMDAAKAAQKQKDYAAAIAAYEKAEKLTNSSYYKAQTVSSRAYCLAQQGKYEEAIAMLQNVEKIKGVPPFCISYAKYDSAQYSEKLKKTDDALKYYLEGSKVEKDCSKPYECMLKAGAILTQQKKYDEAIAIYTECTKAKNAQMAVQGYMGLNGIYTYHKKDLTKALEVLDAAEKLSDTLKGNDVKLRTIYFRAYTYRNFGKTDEAFKEFMRVETVKNPQRDWAAALYNGAAVIAFDNKKDVKLAKELMAKSVSFKSSWGTSKVYEKKIMEAK